MDDFTSNVPPGLIYHELKARSVTYPPEKAGWFAALFVDGRTGPAYWTGQEWSAKGKVHRYSPALSALQRHRLIGLLASKMRRADDLDVTASDADCATALALARFHAEALSTAPSPEAAQRHRRDMCGFHTISELLYLTFDVGTTDHEADGQNTTRCTPAERERFESDLTLLRLRDRMEILRFSLNPQSQGHVAAWLTARMHEASPFPDPILTRRAVKAVRAAPDRMLHVPVRARASIAGAVEYLLSSRESRRWLEKVPQHGQHDSYVLGTPVKVFGPASALAGFVVELSDKWIIQRFVRFGSEGDEENLYEPWPGYAAGMTKEAALEALEECERLWPDLEFRAHRLRLHEILGRDVIERVRMLGRIA